MTAGTSTIRSIFERKYFTYERPILPALHQSSANRAFTNIIPFCRGRFRTAQDMIEESFLEMWRRNSLRSQCFRKHVLQRLHPIGQSHFFIIEGDKKMEMIWHKDICANPRSVLRTLFTKLDQCLMN